MDDLQTYYDVIIVGTGMTESILAAALSRIGKSVLHLDYNEYYGENWASFNFEGIQNWIKKNKNFISSECRSGYENNDPEVNNEVIHRIRPKTNISNIEETWNNNFNTEMLVDNGSTSLHLRDSEDEFNKSQDPDPKSKKFSENIKEFFVKQGRKFNLDLCPKVLFSRGPLVELLISSNIAKYAEFKSVSRVLTSRNECLELVPCSRADVFSTKNITVVEKRLLVKILSLFLKYPENNEEYAGFEKKTFVDYLKHKKLPDNIIHYVLYAIAMGNKETLCLEGIKASKSFLESLGRYGNTPFIFPMYGSGELPQCFCRLCAVFGGVYYLKRGIDEIITEGDKCVAVTSEKKRLNAETYILSSKYLPVDLPIQYETIKMSRGIFICDGPILKSEKEPLTLLVYPPVPQVFDHSVTVVELGPGSCVCPDKFFVIHMTTVMCKDAASDLQHVINSFFKKENSPESETDKPKILWSLTWNAEEKIKFCNNLKNVKFCSGPNLELDYKFSIDEAQFLFQEICPGEEFLPRAPDPDEIVLPDDEGANENSGENEKEESPRQLSTETAAADEDDRVEVSVPVKENDVNEVNEVIS